MKMNKLLISAVCTAVLTLCMAVIPSDAKGSTGSYYSDDEYHADIDFEDVDIVWVDEDATEAFLDEYEETIRSGNSDEIIAGYDRIVSLLDYISTQATLNGIRYYCDIDNEEYAETDLHMEEFGQKIWDRSCSLIRDALHSSAGDDLRAHIDNDDMADALEEYEDMTEEELELDKRYNELTQEYDRIYSEETHAVVDGKDWTYEKLVEDPYVSSDEYYRIIDAIYKERNEKLAPIYIEIVSVLNREAQIDGYDNFADYAYENIYNRDYTTEEIRTVYDATKEYIVPLRDELDENRVYSYKLSNMDLSGEERLKRVGPVIEKIHPDLMEAWDYLTGHHMYTIEYSPDKMDLGYTTSLFSYGAAFIYDQPYRSWKDVETVIHEFGHYNEIFHSNGHQISYIHNVDVSEIHSQGLEVLCLEYADEIYGESCADSVVSEVLFNMVDSVIEGCIYDEFQYRAYTYEGELTTDILNDIFFEINRSYGNDFERDSVHTYWWCENGHNFSSPMYYISYATSALAALDILAMSEENRDAAIDCYMNLTTYHGELGFRETIDDVGLPDIFEEGVIEDISIAVRSYAGLSAASGMMKILTDPVFIVSVIIILAVIAVIIVLRIRTRKARKANNASGMYPPQTY